MMLTLHFYRVYPVINSSMGDRRGKERPRSSGSLEFLRWRNNWRFTSLQISLSFSGKIRLVARAALLWQKYRRINSSSRQDANDSSTDGGGGGRRGGAYTRVHAAPGCIEALVRKRRSHSQHLLAQIVEDIFLASGKFFCPISPSLALSRWFFHSQREPSFSYVYADLCNLFIIRTRLHNETVPCSA